jgi:hypothetical protein
MAASGGPDFARRDAEELARIFRWFGEVECPQLDAHLYRALCRGIADDPDLLALAACAPATQPPPNLLFAAVHYLLLGGARADLREWYPALCRGRARDPESAFPAFRAFCLERRPAIERLVATRLTQTNVVQRCSVLLPCFARVHRAGGGAPLALIEIGPSAGLNMQWHRYRYRYRSDGGALAWGDADSPVLVECELRGTAALPELGAMAPAWRRGVDLHPVDVRAGDSVQWLRALVWPDHPGRQERLTRAIGIARRDPPEILAGSAAERLPELLAGAPDDATLCVYGTHTLYQFPRDALRTTLKTLQSASRGRPIDLITMEGTGDRCAEVRHVAYRDGERETLLLARANPHGRWLEWLAGPAAARRAGGRP